jgi:hypothetical protein
MTTTRRPFAALGIEELSSRRVSGGVPLLGTVTMTPRQSGTARGVRVELVLDEHVPARADEPLEEDRHTTTVVATVPVADQVDLTPGEVVRLPFTLRVPLSLSAPTTSTPEFRIRWLLRAVLDRPLRSDPFTTVELFGTTSA